VALFFERNLADFCQRAAWFAYRLSVIWRQRRSRDNSFKNDQLSSVCPKYQDFRCYLDGFRMVRRFASSSSWNSFDAPCALNSAIFAFDGIVSACDSFAQGINRPD
jgi:hypothetical protein